MEALVAPFRVQHTERLGDGTDLGQLGATVDISSR